MCDLLIKSYNFPVVVLGNDYTLTIHYTVYEWNVTFNIIVQILIKNWEFEMSDLLGRLYRFLLRRIKLGEHFEQEILKLN